MNAAIALFKMIGLEVNASKCNGTAINGKIDFLGQVFEITPLSLSDALLEKAKHLCEVLNSIEIPSHQKYLMFKQNVVTAVNYGPLIDVN